MAEQNAADGSIDAQLAELEKIAERLEDAELDLDEAVRLYERGLALYDGLAKRLDRTELRITELQKAIEEQSKKPR